MYGLDYFDFKYELAEKNPEKYDEFRKNGFVTERPTRLDIAMRKLYFTGQDRLEEEMFEEELLDTLIKVFRKDFSFNQK